MVLSMQSKNSSLVHLVRQTARPRERPPLLVLLHGYGSNEQDLFGLAPYIDNRFLVVSARAPVAMMQDMFAWFPLDWTQSGIAFDGEQVVQARDTIIGFVEEIAATFAVDRAQIYLGGFSQGAIMGAAVAFRRPDLIAGAVLMSGSASPELLPGDVDAVALRQKPFFVTHGTSDTVLPISNGRVSRDLLAKLGVDLTYREYPMGHEVSQQSLADVTAWLAARLD